MEGSCPVSAVSGDGRRDLVSSELAMKQSAWAASCRRASSSGSGALPAKAMRGDSVTSATQNLPASFFSIVPTASSS